MGWSPQCYIPSLVEIGPLVPEKKIFEGFLPYMGVAAILVMWPASCSLIFISLYLKTNIQNFLKNGPVVSKKNKFKFSYVNALGPRSRNDLDLPYLDKLNKLPASTNFQVTGFKSFLKINCFQFFLLKSLSYQIWPCRKLGQGQPRVIIWTNYDGLESPMLHTKFCGNRVHRFLRRRFLKGFYHIWAWQPSWSCDQHHVIKFSFPCTWKLTYKIWLKIAKWFFRKTSFNFHM